MIVVLGLIILVAAIVVGVAGVLSNAGSAHALTHGFAVLGYHVTGSTGTLFLYGIVVGALAMLGLSLLLAERAAPRAAAVPRAAISNTPAVKRPQSASSATTSSTVPRPPLPIRRRGRRRASLRVQWCLVRRRRGVSVLICGNGSGHVYGSGGGASSSDLGIQGLEASSWLRVDHGSAQYPSLVRDYRAGGFPGRRRIRRAPRRRAPRNTTMPMISKYSRPLATTPTMPSRSPRSRGVGRGQASDVPLSRAGQRRASCRSPPVPG